MQISDDAPLLALGRAVLAAQPFSALLGAELGALAPGCAELRLRIDERLTQQHGFAHGGVVSYLADNALTFAGGAALRVPVVTSEFKINYLRPAVGERLIARAQTVSVGRTQAVCRCDVFVVSGQGGDAQEKLCAVAQGTITPLASGPVDAPAPQARQQSADRDDNDTTAAAVGDAR